MSQQLTDGVCDDCAVVDAAEGVRLCRLHASTEQLLGAAKEVKCAWEDNSKTALEIKMEAVMELVTQAITAAEGGTP